jgi:hypothetical protein
MCQLDASRVELHFDGKTETCNILPVERTLPASVRHTSINVTDTSGSRAPAPVALSEKWVF